MFNSFIYWITERENIRLNRLNGLRKPWTKDPILQQYRFCNVRRMDDRVSQWLYENWYLPNLDLDDRNMLLACGLARFINRPDSLEVIGYPHRFDPKSIKRKLREYRDQGNPVFNGAYMVRGNDGMDKIKYVVDYCVSPLKRLLKKIDPSSMRATWEVLKESYGIGSFMAGQIVADLRWGFTGEWFDRETWAPLGPGSLRGMNRLLGNPIKTPMTQVQFENNLLELINRCYESLPKWITDRLEAIDYQNCLCEFDKYQRVSLGEGEPKQRYKGV
jgi:hypothetical protein